MNNTVYQKHSCFILLLFISYMLYGSKAIAQQADSLANKPISTNRPSISQGAGVIPKGTVQAEIGFSYNKDTPGTTEIKAHTYPDILLRFGLLNRLELQLLGSIQDTVEHMPQRRRRVHGIGPVAVGFVGKILDEKKYIPNLAIIGTLTLPVGDKEFRPKHVDPLVLLAASKKVSEKTSVTINGGYSWSGGKPTNHLILNPGTTLSDAVSVYIEVARDKEKGQKAAYIADAGILWLIKNNLQLDLAVGRQLNDLATDFFVTTGISVRLPK
jgi:hypothetical protein